MSARRLGAVLTWALAMALGGAAADDVPARRFETQVEARLALLEPSKPEGYLLLAEEIEARARTNDERTLARELYGLAGALDPARFGVTAALAQANLAESGAERSRLIRLATALRPGSRASSMHEPVSSSTVRFAQLLASYRRGNGVKARDLLGQPDVAALVERHGDAFEGGAAGFRNAVAALRDRPVETQERLVELMFLEEALLASEAGFVSDLLRAGGEPLPACDPMRPGPELRVDPARARWKSGRWSP